MGSTTSAMPIVGETLSDSSDYFTDALLRTALGGEVAPRANGELRNELSTIVVQTLRDGELNADDKQYVVGLVENYTELNKEQAEQRVDNVIVRAEQAARDTADAALESATFASLWLFVALLIGAYLASLMTTIGGRQRDSVIH